MKKLINDPNDVVAEALLGIEAAHPDLRVDHQNKIIYRGDAPQAGKVGLISGGGSGHEPLHGGFVGLGMLDAACAGEVFTSPVPDQMLAATKLVDGGAGVLHVVKNYTGDVMNFEMAAELAAAETGARVVSVVTDDDVAVQDSTWTAGRRGVGVTVLLEKIAGAAAEQGRDLDAGRRRRADGQRQRPQHGRGADLLHGARRPASPTFELGEDEMELGVGIHGEPGSAARAAGARRRRSPRCWSSRSWPTCRSRAGDRVIAFVNGLGGTPLIELYVMYNEVEQDPGAGTACTVARSLVGSYITSLDMAGCVGHPAQGRRRAALALGRSGQDAGTAVGNLTRWLTARPRRSSTHGCGAFAAPGRREPGLPHRARRGDRRRRPRRPTWTGG